MILVSEGDFMHNARPLFQAFDIDTMTLQRYCIETFLCIFIIFFGETQFIEDNAAHRGQLKFSEILKMEGSARTKWPVYSMDLNSKEDAGDALDKRAV
ncbi:hypothetical protein CEXT_273641 [Caerostris extrusa]|uniref:Uncharacterized protein n=1 Tax=Caerostris extrusa TaxID=172846 RepID=A0AAV4RSK2_CAEEX|nr:hypothetical protein CEXT_273641 [Caerostris extrusa]